MAMKYADLEIEQIKKDNQKNYTVMKTYMKLTLPITVTNSFPDF